MDYASLRAEALRQLERMAGGVWTDFNAHDPGITILEQLCYALSDLGYRTAHPIPDLLAEGDRDPHESLHGAAEILSSSPVTLDDLRRIVLDVEDVWNAWIVPLEADTVPLYHDPARRELSLTPQGPASEPIAIQGLYRVLLDAAPGTGSRARREVARRLHANRGLCEDLAEIRVLDPMPVAIDATVEIGTGVEATDVHAEILRRLADSISPRVAFTTLAELLRSGRPVDEIFEGPRLDHGFILDEALERARRREAINTSDIVRVIMDVPGVRAVSRVSLASGSLREPWSLGVPAGQVAKLDVPRSTLTLRRGGKPVVLRASPAVAVTAAPPVSREDLPRPAGRDRRVADYMSVQQQFPAIYGIGELGLPSTATPERRAQAKQLQAYLLIFDQIMANHLAQLAHAADLLSFDGEERRTYFAQPVTGPGLGIEAVRPPQDELAVLYRGFDDEVDRDRRARFLEHLLARFGEVIDDHGATSRDALDRARQTFLRRAPRLGGARGAAHDILRPPGEDNRSGVEERVRLKLGLGPDEATLVIEHVLLRPTASDREQQSPLLAAAPRRDPYSFQLTFVFKDEVGRFDARDTHGFKVLAAETVRAETPAHLSPRLLWLKESEFAAVVAAHDAWLYRLRASASEEGSARESMSDRSRQFLLRSARDRLIDLLGVGETSPLTDVAVDAQRLTVSVGGSTAFDLDPTQRDVRYELCAHGQPLSPPCAVVGADASVVLPGPRIEQDRTFQVRATKLDRPARSVLLERTVTVKVGLDTSLRVSFAGPALVDFGATVEVRVERSQEQVHYQLVHRGMDGAEVTTVGEMGTGGELVLRSDPVGEDTPIRVTVRRTFDPSERRAEMSGVLDTTLSLSVRANPDLEVAFEGSPLVDPGAVAIVVAQSQPSVTYSVFVRSLRDADFDLDGAGGRSVLAVHVPAAPPDVAEHEVRVVAPPCPVELEGFHPQGERKAGNGGPLRLALGPLPDDSIAVVQADKGHSAIQLRAVAVALPRPSPAPELALAVSAAADGPGSVLHLTGGQRGVFHHFRLPGQAAECGLPAYVHRLDETDPSSNHGLGALRVEVDFVVTDDPPTDGDLARQLAGDPRVALGDLAAPAPDAVLELDVMAVRARSGVGWIAPRRFTARKGT